MVWNRGTVRVYKEISIYQIRVSFETLFNVNLSLCYGDFFFPVACSCGCRHTKQCKSMLISFAKFAKIWNLQQLYMKQQFKDEICYMAFPNKLEVGKWNSFWIFDSSYKDSFYLLNKRI